jgi:hypothetical protein
MTRWLLTLFLCSQMLPAQDVPVTGYFRDSANNFRRLQNLPGAWVAPLAHQEPVRAAGSSRASAWFKTDHALSVLWPDGRQVTVEAPPGAAIGSFTAAGQPFAFYFPESNAVHRWNSVTESLEETEIHPSGRVAAVGPTAGSGDIQVLESEEPAVITPQGEVLRPPVQADALEPLDDDLYLIRQGNNLLAWRPGADLQVVPQADGAPIGLYLRDPSGTEIPVTGSFQMPAVAAGESSEARFRIRNQSGAVLNIQRLSIDPGPFSTFEQFYPPKVLAVDAFADFAVRFHPTESGEFSSILHVNDLLVTLRGATIQSATFEIQEGGGWRPLTSAAPVDLGSTPRQATLERRIRVTPATESPAISGSSFTLVPAGPEGEWLIRFNADKAGTYTAKLSVPGREITLTAYASEFPPPRLVVSPTAGSLDPAQQVKVQIHFAEPAKLNTLGILRLSFSSAWPLAAPDDSAISFLPKLERTVYFHVNEGASLADFNGDDFVTLQTGTTAGVITLSAEIGLSVQVTQYRLQSLPVSLTASKASVASGNAEVLLTGFDNTRSITRASFTFYLKSGQAASPGRLDADVTENFRAFFKDNATGAFRLRAGFPVSGTVTELDGVEVEIINSQGARQTGRLRFE